MLFALLAKVAGQISDGYTLDAIQDSIDRQLTVYPQEKIHLHTDRNIYVPGERIWFKAYVADALMHLTPTYSRYVYVELINSGDSLVDRVMIRQGDDDMFHGNLFLSELVPEGDYTLRAYTRYMENRGEDYFFRKTIHIGKLQSGDESKENRKKKNRAKTDYDVSFYPEGGNLIENTFCKIAFKALNSNGLPEEITGEIVDSEGTYINTVKTFHSGMGYFAVSTRKGMEYFLNCRNRSGVEKRFKLPEIRDTYSLVSVRRNSKHFVTVRKPPESPAQHLYLLVHCRGMALYFASWNEERESVSFSEDMLPPGVIQILLFDGDMNPLSERLIFNKSLDDANLVYSTDKTEYKKREKVLSEIYLTDDDGFPSSGNLSVAITDDRDVAIDSLTTICSSLLLSSELRGHIESPAFYLQNSDTAEIALDLLMMTHGWRRYDIPEAIKGKVEEPELKYEATQDISGTVKSLMLGKPVVNGEVSLFSLDGAFGQTTTNSLGFFIFHGFDFPDSTNFFIQAKSEKGSNRVELLVKETTYPPLKHIPDHDFQDYADLPDETKGDFIKKAEQRARYDDDMRIINLAEVVVVAKRVEKKDEARLNYWANSSSDATMYREDIERMHVHNVTTLLYSFAGIRVGGNGSISIRGADGPPLILIDGVSMEWPDNASSVFDSPLEYVSIEDVETIDVFKGASAAIFGMRGGNGAISITTRRGGSSDYTPSAFNYASLSPLGYQKPVEFYSPKYDTPAAVNLGIPDYRTTIYWKPDITVSDEGKASFEFYTSDFPTTYSVVIEGLSSGGGIIRKVERIEVK
jgi:TonB-dependent SusC/RagA subfamily outer membrane receptor